MAYKYKYRLILFFAAELKITLVILGGDIFSSWVVSARSEICYWLQTPVIPTSSPTVASNKEALPPQLRLITTPSFSVSAFACRTIRKHKEKSMNKNHIRLRFFCDSWRTTQSGSNKIQRKGAVSLHKWNICARLKTRGELPSDWKKQIRKSADGSLLPLLSQK